MFAFVSILLVAAVSSHKMFAIFDGINEAVVITEVAVENNLNIDITPDVSFGLTVSGNLVQFTSTRAFTCQSTFAIRNQAISFAKVSSTDSPFLGTIMDTETKRVAYVFIIPDGPSFDVDFSIKMAHDFMTLTRDIRESLSIETIKLLMDHLYRYSKSREGKICEERGITALSVYKKTGVFTYHYGVEKLLEPVYVSFEDQTALIKKMDGTAVPASIMKLPTKIIENDTYYLISSTDSAFIGVLDHQLIKMDARTYLLVNAQPVDILKMLEVLKLKDKTFDEVYEFSTELFKLAASDKVNLAKDFMSIPKHTRDFIDSIDGEKERVMDSLKKHREARGNKDYNELGITAVTVKDGKYAYAVGKYATEDYPISITVVGDTAVIQKGAANFPTAIGEFFNDGLGMKLTNAFLGVATYKGERHYFLVNAEALDIIIIEEVLKFEKESPGKSLDEVYKFASDLFKLASTNYNAIRNLQLHRAAREHKNVDNLGITSVTVSKSGMLVRFAYSESEEKRISSLWKVTASSSGVLIYNLQPGSTKFPSLMGKFTKNILKITDLRNHFIGVVGDYTDQSELTLIFVGMVAIDILKLTEASTSFAEKFSVDGVFKILEKAFGGSRMTAMQRVRKELKRIRYRN